MAAVGAGILVNLITVIAGFLPFKAMPVAAGR